MLGEEIDGLVGGLAAAAHQHDDLLGVRRSDVIEQVILSPDDSGEVVHALLDDPGALEIVRVDGLASLEVDVRVLAGASKDRAVRVHASAAVGQHQLVVDHRPHVVDGQLLDLVDLVRGAEAVEEVDERHAGFERGG